MFQNERDRAVDEALVQLRALRQDLLWEKSRLKIQLAHLQCDEVGWFLYLRRGTSYRSQLNYTTAVIEFTIIQAEIQKQRDRVRSELVEAQLLLDHIYDQMVTLSEDQSLRSDD